MTVAEQISAEEVLAHKLEQYAGRWVAVRDHGIVADDESLEGLLEQVEKISPDVEVFRVAEDPSVACFY
jgi:hypothetical protein